MRALLEWAFTNPHVVFTLDTTQGWVGVRIEKCATGFCCQAKVIPILFCMCSSFVLHLKWHAHIFLVSFDVHGCSPFQLINLTTSIISKTSLKIYTPHLHLSCDHMGSPDVCVGYRIGKLAVDMLTVGKLPYYGHVGFLLNQSKRKAQKGMQNWIAVWNRVYIYSVSQRVFDS
jgi:hypothetical protein